MALISFDVKLKIAGKPAHMSIMATSKEEAIWVAEKYIKRDKGMKQYNAEVIDCKPLIYGEVTKTEKSK